MSVERIIILCIFAVMTVIGFLSMYIDKRRAENGKWRIKEATLFAIAFLFGGVGSTVGMWTFRHKTKHWYFVVFMPVAALVSVAATVLLYLYI